MAVKIKYAQGDLVSVPLRSGGWATGVISRLDGNGSVFGYFFGPKISRLDEVAGCTFLPDQAILICMFGDYGLVNGIWSVIGHLEGWSSSDWDMPPLMRYEKGEQYAYLSYYDDSLNFIGEKNTGFYAGCGCFSKR